MRQNIVTKERISNFAWKCSQTIVWKITQMKNYIIDLHHTSANYLAGDNVSSLIKQHYDYMYLLIKVYQKRYSAWNKI